MLARPKSFVAEAVGGGVPRVEKLDLPEAGAADAKIVESHVEEREGPQLGDASIIVSGGRGLGSPEAYELVEKLGKQLKAATGATRAIVDAGWVPYANRWARPGRPSSPTSTSPADLRRNAASGRNEGLEDHHRHQQRCDSPIFSIADLGAVGDVHKGLPKLMRHWRAAEQMGIFTASHS